MSFPVNMQGNNQPSGNPIQLNNNHAPIKKGDTAVQNISFTNLNINTIDGLADSSSCQSSPDENALNKYQSLALVKDSDDAETRAFYASLATDIEDQQRRNSNSLREKAEQALKSPQGKNYKEAAPLLLEATMLDLNNDDAADLLDAIQKDAEKDPNAALAFALTYKELNCYDQAKHYFDKAISLGSEEAQVELEKLEDESDKRKLKKLEEFLLKQIEQKEKEQVLQINRRSLTTLNEDEGEVDMDLTKIGVTPAANKKELRKFSFSTKPPGVDEGKEREEDLLSEEQVVINLQSPRGPRHTKQLSQSITTKEEGDNLAEASCSSAIALLKLGKSLEAAKLLKVAISLGSEHAQKIMQDLSKNLSNV